MNSSEQGVDVVIIVFIVACRFFLDVLLNRRWHFLWCEVSNGFRIRRILSKQVVAIIAIIRKQIVVIVTIIRKQVFTVVFSDLRFVFNSTGSKQVVVLAVIVE